MYIRKPKERVINWDGDLLICTTCKLGKEEKEFGPDKRNRCRNFKSNYCKDCSKLRFRKKLKEYSNNTNFDFYISRLYYGINDRVKNSKKVNILNSDLVKEDLINLFKKQKGKCAISGIEMTYITGKGTGMIPNNISVDRIDSLKGYNKDNIQLVCSIVNIMKSNLPLNELVYYCEQIINNNNNERSNLKNSRS